MWVVRLHQVRRPRGIETECSGVQHSGEWHNRRRPAGALWPGVGRYFNCSVLAERVEDVNVIRPAHRRKAPREITLLIARRIRTEINLASLPFQPFEGTCTKKAIGAGSTPKISSPRAGHCGGNLEPEGMKSLRHPEVVLAFYSTHLL